MAASVVAWTPEDLPHRALKPEYQRQLEEGLEERYGAAASLILHMVWQGWSLTHVMVALLDAGNLASDRYLRMPRFKARRQIQKDFDRAREKVAAELRCRRADAAKIATFERWCQERLQGRTRLTDFAVLQVLVARCVAQRSLTSTISSRTIALDVGRSPATVQRALHRLATEHGVIAARSSDKGTWYRLLADSSDEALSCSPCPVQGTASSQEPAVSSSHAVFDPSGLGPSAGLVYAAAAGGRTARQVAAESRLSVSRVHALLADLRAYGLAIKADGVWHAVDVDLDDLARHLGVYATRQKRAARISRERDQWSTFKGTEAARTAEDRQRAMDWKRQALDDLERRRRPLPVLLAGSNVVAGVVKDNAPAAMPTLRGN
jgi:hypothetical protein